jgi:hypothetical protein
VAGACEHGNAPDVEFQRMSDYQLLKKGSSPWSLYVRN